MEQALDTADVARLLKFSDPECVQKLAKRGELVGRKVGGEWRFHPDAVRAFLMGEPAKPPPEPDPPKRRRRDAEPEWLAGVPKTLRK